MNYLYRMTHIANLPHILEYGITHKSSVNANPRYVPIGDRAIIEKRAAGSVTTVNGKTIVPGEFIPFYFYARMPMLYNIQHGYNVSKVSPEDIVYLVVSLASITADHTFEYCFSDAHAVWSRARFYDSDSIDEIDEILDQRAIRNDDWGDDYYVRERKQAEFLVRGDVPPTYIAFICCYSEEARAKILSLHPHCPVLVTPKGYY